MVAIGIIGAGNRGRHHASQYGESEHADVVAVADVDEAAARALAEEFSLSATYGDYRDLLADDAVDAVSVCVHNNLHAPMTVDALRAGKHVFCEKPMAGSYADAERMYAAAQETGNRLAVQNYRLTGAETRAARRLVADGRLGDVYLAHASYERRRNRPYVDGYGTPSFVSEDATGGGAVLDVGPYPVGRALSLMDSPRVERVKGRTFDHGDAFHDPANVGENADRYRERYEGAGYDVEDVGVGMADLANGATLTLRASWAMQFEGAHGDHLVGTDGGVAFEPLRFFETRSDLDLAAEVDVDSFEYRERQYENVATDQFAHWAQVLAGEAESLDSATVALESMAFMEGVYLSAELGREVAREEIVERSESTAVDP